MRYINRPHRLSSLLLAAGILLLSLLAIAITQASNLAGEGGLLFLNVPALEIIPKGAIINRLSLGIGEKPDSGLIINTAIRPFTGVAHMTRTVTSVVPAGNGSTVSAPLFTQENIFTSNGKEAVTHETYYSATNERAYLRRLARLANNHAAAPAYGPVQEGQQPPIPSALATVDTSGLLARSLRVLLMAMGPATDGQVLSYQKGKLVWIDIDEAYSSLHPISSGRIPYVQPADGSPVERHYGGGGGGGNQTSGSTSGGSQRDFAGQPINLSSEVTGILAVSRGGTGLSSIGSGSLLLGNAAGTFTDFGIGSNGQVLTVTPTGGLMWSSVAVTGLSQLYADLHYVKQTAIR